MLIVIGLLISMDFIIKYEKLGKGERYIDMGSLNKDDLMLIITQCKEYHFSVICNQ